MVTRLIVRMPVSSVRQRIAGKAAAGWRGSPSLRAQSTQGSPHFDATSEIQEIKVVGDWAFMWTKLTVVVTPAGGGGARTRAGHTLSVLKKENGKWLLARDANLLS